MQKHARKEARRAYSCIMRGVGFVNPKLAAVPLLFHGSSVSAAHFFSDLFDFCLKARKEENARPCAARPVFPRTIRWNAESFSQTPDRSRSRPTTERPARACEACEASDGMGRVWHRLIALRPRASSRSVFVSGSER